MRPITLLAPNIGLIVKAVLYSKGYKNIDDLCLKLLKTLSTFQTVQPGGQSQKFGQLIQYKVLSNNYLFRFVNFRFALSGPSLKKPS